MHELYYEASLIFRTHDILNKYATSKNINIVNKSSFSLVDAYERD